MIILPRQARDKYIGKVERKGRFVAGFPFGIINPFLTELAEAMHNATPPLGISYDAGSENPEGSTVPWCGRNPLRFK
jgi:hypothetical protein